MINNPYQIEVINRIRQLRIDREVSQIGLANIIGVSNGQIGNIESLKFKHKYTLKQLYQIATHFKVTIDWVLTGEDSPLSTDDLIKALINYE